MLEGLVAWVLNNYLGKYVENLNTDQLSVALLSGKVELENLPLKKDALRHLGLPVEVKAGFIGKVQLQVPVRQIRSAPWLIAIEKLYLVAAPVNLDEWDSEVEGHIAHDRKVALLDAIEAQWRAESEATDAGYYATSYSSWLNYGTGLLANIVENLQLKLMDVHVRYEDVVTCAPGAFACGLTVESLAAESCDSDWRAGFTLLADPNGCSYKLMELHNLALYWDGMHAPAGMYAHCNIAQLTERMSQTWTHSHRYVVRPTSASARVRRERTELPLRSRTRPRLHARLTLDTVLLDLTSRQYSEAVRCVLGLEKIGRLREFRMLRPSAPVKGHARAWWLYALSCHIPIHQWTEPKPTWDSCMDHSKKTRQYVEICLWMLSNPAATLPADKKAIKDEFEWCTPLHVLKPLRQVAMRKVPKSSPTNSPDQPGGSGRSMLVQWFPQWWGWYGASPERPPSEAPPVPASAPAPSSQAPPHLEEEILDVIADSIDNNTLLKRDTVFGKFEFILNKGSLNLCMDEADGDRSGSKREKEESSRLEGGADAAIELQFSGVSVGVESRPRASSHALHVSLGALQLRERITPDTLFPILCAPQGVIRDGLSAMSATASAMGWCRAHSASHAHHPSAAPHPQGQLEPIFQLTYEKKPFGLNCDYKLWVKSAALEMVYSEEVARWVRTFVGLPWRGAEGEAQLWPEGSAGGKGAAGGDAWHSPLGMRAPTRNTLMNHWEQIVHAHAGDRRSWQVELDISAPQILFVEQLSSRDSAVLVVDFGRLRLANAALLDHDHDHAQDQDQGHDNRHGPHTPNEDDEMFMTPCSTPPGSLLSPSSPPQVPPKHVPTALDAADLHTKLYERYNIQLSDLQILVGRVRDNWKYAHTKSTSSLHLLDRFSISLQAERRVVHTSDPQYPDAALCGSLPSLVVHLSEHKLNALTAVLANSPLFHFTSKEPAHPGQASEEDEESSISSETERSEYSSHQNSTLFMLQFAIDQMSLEVQSLGRSIAEVQVMGVRACALAASRPRDPSLSLSLSVHSLLLVDALQTYGPDFELLVASHKHVGMDTASGSILGSEPTSPNYPTSPTSPTCPSSPDARSAPHPYALHQALYSLHQHGTSARNIPELEKDRTSPGPSWPHGAWNGSGFGSMPGGPGSWASGGGGGGGGAQWGAAGLVDSEALIAVELCLVKGEGDSEDLRICNILFNNLDIIANQETIVELIGFGQRVMGGRPAAKKPSPENQQQPSPATVPQMTCSVNEEEEVRKVRTEITFDFHRLGVLLLRAAVHEGNVVAKKIATATISEAKIQATVDGSRVEVGGSLGGVQVVALCEGGGLHARVLHAGRAPPAHASHAAHALHASHALHAADQKALLFNVNRKVIAAEEGVAPAVEALVSVRVASVWYTHSGPLLRELSSCLTEFKQYLANLARSIRAAAADMAIGLVHPRGESLYSNPRGWGGLEGVSPRRRTTSLGNSLDEPPDLADENILLSVNIELESPVVVVPRSAQSAQVFVAHLGRMSLANRPGPPQHTLYKISVRDISLATLDVAEKLKVHQLTAENMSEIYDVADGKPLLHNTALQLSINCCDGDADGGVAYQCEVSGKVVGGLHVTAHREQYEQLLDTLDWITTSSSPAHPSYDVADSDPAQAQGGVVEPAVPTLRLDPAVRAAVLAVPPPDHRDPAAAAAAAAPLTVNFELPMFTVELRADLGEGERSLVELTFKEFIVNYEKTHEYETSLQVSLHSITMEDLTKEVDSKHRLLMVSHAPHLPPKAVFLSKSCPDFLTHLPNLPHQHHTHLPHLPSLYQARGCSTSLPAHLNVMDKKEKEGRRKCDSACGVTPPCSPEAPAPGESLSAEDNLVWLSVQTTDPRHPHFEDKFNKVSKLTKVEFNSLNLVVSIDSWVAVLDFFGIAADDLPEEQKPEQQKEESESPSAEGGVTQTEMSIRSLCVVAVGRRGEVARAQVARVRLVARAEARARTRHVAGSLGALLLTDLSAHAPLWRDRFRTHGDQALTFDYRRLSSGEALSGGHETSASVAMGPATYVHSRRFVLELQAFAREFSLFRRVIAQARLKVSVGGGQAEGGAALERMRIAVRCSAPVIVLPVSGRSRLALLAHLHGLRIDNRFRLAGDADTVSTLADPDKAVRETLDVRSVHLEGLSLWMARGEGGGGAGGGGGGGGLSVRRSGPPLLHAPAHLTLQVEHNITGTHNVPDMSVQGTLTTLQCALDPAQYRLVRGVLAHNLAEPVDDLLPHPHRDHSHAHAHAHAQANVAPDQVWTTTSLKFDLHDVTVKLVPEHGVTSLACINFIKSKLLVETYSDSSQDIDLVSQEILVSDTRYANEPANRRANVFSSIVQPMREHRHSVQAEVHARKRRDSSAYTILVNNMRLMAVLDWWEAANQFIMQPPPPPADPDQQHLEEALAQARSAASPHSSPPLPEEEAAVELKLNITDSQLVLVEDPSVWDTNAVILRSTAVVTYRSAGGARPLRCELSQLEVFSCVLGLEADTALAILEPADVHATVDARGLLHISTSTLNLRLSYHDMRMFAAMLRSLPVQARAALSGKALLSNTLDDAPANCIHMRSQSAESVNETANRRAAGASETANFGWMHTPKWMRAQARVDPPPPPPPTQNTTIWPLTAVQVNAECITLCVIDDCLDSDVPLLEVSLSDLQVEQDLRKVEDSMEDPMLVCTPASPPIASPSPPNPASPTSPLKGGGGAGGGRLSALLTVDYYNRILSGWEPIVEPWRFETSWEYTLSSALSLGRVQARLASAEVLSASVTSTLVELGQLVRDNWAADYYAPQQCVEAEQSPKGSPSGHRRRSPFVPYALRNHTGHKLWFTTLLTTSDVLREQPSWSGPDDSWMVVRAGETEPFSFGTRRGRGGAGSGGGAGVGRAHQPAALHQLALRMDGWAPPDPVCVDRVGVFFRQLTHAKTGEEARLVFEVSLEGSARKLVTVRSALQVLNKLPHPMEVRVDQAPSAVQLALSSASHAVRAMRARCALVRRAHAHRPPLLPPPPPPRGTPTFACLLHPLTPPSLNCVQWSGGAARWAIVEAGGRWAAPVSGHASAVRARPLHAPQAPHGAHAGHGPRAPHAPHAPHTPATIHWSSAPAPTALNHYECRAPPDHVYRFCCVIVRERFPPDRGPVIAGHTLTLVPALRLENLLPLELQFKVTAGLGEAGPVCAGGAVPPGDTRPLHEVNVEEGVELSVKLEGFAWSTAVCVGGAGVGAAGGGGGGGGGAGSFSARLKLRDSRQRRLYLNARVTFKKTDGVKVSVSAAYWLVNRTGLPLVFRAEGGAAEAAGQFEEHEVARMVAPLLFSFAEADGGPTLAARLGYGMPGHPEWCSPFGLGPGVAVKRLEVRGGGDVGEGGGGGERVYVVGVRVRSGRARYRHTNIVTLTPRYQLHNNTSHHLQFSQKCTATTLNDPGAIATHVSAVSGCYLPWHWPRFEREQLLCVRVLAPQRANAGAGAGGGGAGAYGGGGASNPAPCTAWSGGFRLDTPRTLHLACREPSGKYKFLRVEVVCQGATMFIVLTDGESAPPPLRIDNYSPVSIMFHQVGCGEECVVGAHARLSWALPEPSQPPALALRAPGGPRTTLPLDLLPATHYLLYQNFIYVAFTHTQNRATGDEKGDSDALVLEVALGSRRVVLARKRYGERAQLWRRGPQRQLVHEGSSPPHPTDALLPEDRPLSPHDLVLDIEDAAPRPGCASALVLRRADPRRASTQAWRLTPAGRMCCAHANLCVQPDGMALMALTPGNRVVLGLPRTSASNVPEDPAPAEQAVSWHTLRPGSGRLQVSLCAEGPTRLVKIHDVKAPESGWIEGGEEEEEDECEGLEKRKSREWGVRVALAGVSVSLVSRSPPEELVHALFSNVLLEMAFAKPNRTTSLALALAVQHMQWDNQLLGSPSPVLLYCLPPRGAAQAQAQAAAQAQPTPALHAAVELRLSPTRRYHAYLFNHLVVALSPLAIRLEERLILKVWAWAWTDDEESAREQPDEADYETRRMLDELTALHATRYYFALIKIIPSQIRLSMCTANKLEPGLAALKRRLALTMIKFEDAAVELEPFARAHVFDTASFLTRQMLAHFKDELKWQAAKILGSVDFLGNPLGFVADVSEGVTGLLLEGNVGALFKNVTHGISNSAAKVTESLGDGLERVVGDEAHEETRRRIRSGAAGAHLSAGLRGLGLGILGGMTSLVKHSYEGAAAEGLGGFVAGVGKGLLGTVTKPLIGVLDLAAETASALRDTSRRADRGVPARVRGPRCCAGPGALLPRYCAAQAQGAALLYALNGSDYAERFLAYRIVRDTPHDIRALLSDHYVRIFTCKHAAPQIVMETHLSNLVSCLVVQSEGAHYVELGVRGGGGSGGASGSGGGGGGGPPEGVRRPRVQCDSAELAAWMARHAAYARQLYHEHTHTLTPHADL